MIFLWSCEKAGKGCTQMMRTDWTWVSKGLYLKTIYNNKSSSETRPAFPHATTESTKHRDRARWFIVSEETQVHIPCCSTHHTHPSTILGPLREEKGLKRFIIKLQTPCCMVLLFQICISSSSSLSFPSFSSPCYFPSLKTSPSFLISVKLSLERVKFILFNVLLLDKHLWTTICLAEVLFPLDTSQQPASWFLQPST